MGGYHRFVSVDFGKGLAIFGMVFLHFFMFWPETPEDLDHPFALTNGFLQLHHGLFFFFSAFGNGCSIRSQMEKADERKTGSYKSVYLTSLLRGFLTISLAIVAKVHFKSFFYSLLFNPIFGEDLGKRYTDEWKSGLFAPDVIPYIGMCTMLNGLVFTLVNQIGNRQQWGPMKRIKVLVGFVISLFVMTIGLRRGLDVATCAPCVAFKCRTVSQLEVLNAGLAFPNKCFETNDPTMSWNDVADFHPCQNFGGNETEFEFCTEEILKKGPFNVVKGLSTDNFQHISDADRGFRWCPTNVSRDSLDCENGDSELCTPSGVEAGLEMCQLAPWYAPGIKEGDGPGRAMYDRTNAGQKIVQLLVVLLFGRYGYFAFGTISMAGFVVALYVNEFGWTKELFRAMYISSLIGAAIGIPLSVSLFLPKVAGNEALQMGGAHMRLFIGASELLVFTVFATWIEGRPSKGCGCCCGWFGSARFAHTRTFRFFKRFGTISFTIYEMQWFVMDVISLIVSAVGNFTGPFCMGDHFPLNTSCARNPESNIPILIVSIIANTMFWVLLLPVWEKFNFVGSFEWMMQKALTKTRKSKSNALTAGLTEPENDEEEDVELLKHEDEEMGFFDPCLSCCQRKPKQVSSMETPHDDVA